MVENELAKAVQDFKESQEQKTFAGRHPELGRMITCVVCGLRHRSIQVCRQKFVIEAPGPGRHQFAKQRFHPHYSKHDLQLVQLTQQMFSKEEPFWGTPLEAMKEARKKAQRILTEARKFKSRIKRIQQQESRRINREN
jgi:hypothetical protein